MTEQQATAIAEVYGGEPWQSGGGIWIVTKELADGSVVAFCDEAVVRYANREMFECGECVNEVLLY